MNDDRLRKIEHHTKATKQALYVIVFLILLELALGIISAYTGG